jgi:hypothetical protein
MLIVDTAAGRVLEPRSIQAEPSSTSWKGFAPQMSLRTSRRLPVLNWRAAAGPAGMLRPNCSAA